MREGLATDLDLFLVFGCFRREIRKIIVFVDVKDISVLEEHTCSRQDTHVKTVMKVTFTGTKFLEFFAMLLGLLDALGSIVIGETRAIPGKPSQVVVLPKLLGALVLDSLEAARKDMIPGAKRQHLFFEGLLITGGRNRNLNADFNVIPGRRDDL